MSKLTKEQHQEICKLYESGMTVPQLASKYSIVQASVCYILNKHNVVRRPYVNRKNVDVEMFKAAKLSGMKTDEICKEFGIATGTVAYYCNKLGIHSHTWVSKDENAAMIAYRNDGLSNAQIALRIGRSESTVHRRLGCQPVEITKNSRIYGGKIRRLNTARRNAAKLAMKRKLEEDARLEAERKAAEEAARIAEEKRLACEDNIREIFSVCGIPLAENFRIESAEQGSAMIANLHQKTYVPTVA